MAETKAAFRRRLGRLLSILRTATTSGTGDTNTFIAVSLTDHYPSDDSLNGASVYDVTGAEWRRVTDWLASTGTGDVNRVFSASQASGRAIEIYEQFTPDDLDFALQMAVTECYPYVATRVVDTTLLGIANQYEYTVPAAIRDLERMRGGRVQYEVNEAVSTFPYADLATWEVRQSGETQTLVLPSVSGMVGRTIRLIGWGIPAYPSTDATSIPLEEDTLQLLAYKAAEIAWRSGSRTPGRDAEFSTVMAQRYEEQFTKMRDVWGVKMVPGSLRPPEGLPYVEAPLSYYRATPG